MTDTEVIMWRARAEAAEAAIVELKKENNARVTKLLIQIVRLRNELTRYEEK